MNVIELWSTPQPQAILAATLVPADATHPKARGVILIQDPFFSAASPYWIAVVYQLPDGRWRTDGEPNTYWDKAFVNDAWTAYRKRATALLA